VVALIPCDPWIGSNVDAHAVDAIQQFATASPPSPLLQAARDVPTGDKAVSTVRQRAIAQRGFSKPVERSKSQTAPKKPNSTGVYDNRVIARPTSDGAGRTSLGD
jgi:hypothetical protein